MKKVTLIVAVIFSAFFCSAQNNLNDIKIKLEEGNLAINAGYYADALKIYEECLLKNDSLPEAKYGAAHAAYLAGNGIKAKKYIHQFLNNNTPNFKSQPEYKKAFELAALIEQLEKSAIDMVFVNGGNYVAGCKDSRDIDCEGEEKPAHPVVVGDFYIAKTEVTQAQWTKIMGDNPSGFKGCDDCPVENVSWDSIQVFIEKLNRLYPGLKFRLPTEGEWEFAARGGNQSRNFKYCGSNSANEVSWYDSNSVLKTHPVATKLPNELGLYDMGGNVWEWCSDCFDFYTESPQVNPQGSTKKCTHRSDRGGCWQYTSKYSRPGTRGGLNPYEISNDLGFRLARTAVK